jgi:hypothetical protein
MVFCDELVGPTVGIAIMLHKVATYALFCNQAEICGLKKNSVVLLFVEFRKLGFLGCCGLYDFVC